ncbi:MAG TPA: potassium transporter [Anaeromyxobacter sp.]|nr:potassium transporter [Anaeromyxobacter sp.]
MGELGATRVFGQHGGGVVVIGLERRPMRDLYHWLVTGSWTRLIVVFAAVYFATLGIFGAARLLVALRLPLEGSLLEALSQAAVAPEPEASAFTARGVAAAVVAALDGFFHWVELVIGAGIVLAKFSLVRARVLFSNVAVVAPHEGGQALMFRMANERTSHIVDAKVTVMLVRNEVQDGEPVRRAYDLYLVRRKSALFSHAWTAVHAIDGESPLRGESAASLEGAEAEVIVNVSGFDEGLVKTVHARHVYRASRIRWGARFREIVKKLPDGRHAVDYRKFHKTVSIEEGAAPERDRAPTRKAR